MELHATRKIIMIKTNDLHEYRNNPRKNEKAVEATANSIREFGFNQPIVIDKNHEIVCGHTRIKAARKLGIEAVPCILVDDLTPEQVKAYRLADNKTSELADWDMQLLGEELAEISDLDMQDFGFDMSSLSVPDIVEEESIPDIPDIPKAKIGDIYRLDSHVLMCGDCTNTDNIKMLIGNRDIDMVFTDPPYDMDMGGGGAFAKTMENCKNRIADIVRFDPYTIKHLSDLRVNSLYIFTSKNGVAKYLDIFSDYNYDILCWCKTNPVPFTSGTFLPDIEYLLYFNRKGRIWNNSIKPTSVYKKYYVTDKLQGRKDGNGDLHPTMKPLEIITDKIMISSNVGGVVLDLFGGSRTTLIACEQTKRTCCMMELNPAYVDVIIKRWEDFTGKKAEKISG